MGGGGRGLVKHNHNFFWDKISDKSSPLILKVDCTLRQILGLSVASVEFFFKPNITFVYFYLRVLSISNIN